jgi:hypothetical protein
MNDFKGMIKGSDRKFQKWQVYDPCRLNHIMRRDDNDERGGMIEVEDCVED